jgi:hypothetical protein
MSLNKLCSKAYASLVGNEDLRMESGWSDELHRKRDFEDCGIRNPVLYLEEMRHEGPVA